MSSPASVAKHPIHPMLVVFPVGLWIFSFICDLIYQSNHSAMWNSTALYCMGGGIVGALLAAIPGLIDYLSIRDSRAKMLGTFHLVLNLCAVVLYCFNFWWRLHTTPGGIGPLVLSLVTIIALAISGWLGGEMVYVHGVGVDQTHHHEEQDIRRAG